MGATGQGYRVPVTQDELWRHMYSEVSIASDVMLYTCHLPRGWILDVLTTDKERKW